MGRTNTSDGQLTALNIPLGGTANVMPGSSQFKAVGSVLARTVYSALAAAYPAQNMYYSMSQSPIATPSQNTTLGVISSLAYGAGIYIAVISTRLYSSADLITFTPCNVPGVPYNAVAFGGGAFVAVPVGAGNCVYSANGNAWNAGGAVMGADRIVYASTSGSFVASSDGQSTIAYSKNGGVSWTYVSPGLQNGLGLAATAGAIVLMPRSGNTASSGVRSTDGGATWSSFNLPSAQGWGVAAANGTNFVALGGITNTTVAAYSNDNGATWNASSLPVGANWQSVTYNSAAGLYLAVGWFSSNSPSVFATSPDGAVWTLRTYPLVNAFVINVVVANGQSVLQFNSYTSVMATSTNNLTFTPRIVFGQPLGAIAAGNGIYLTSSGAGNNVIAGSTDGLSWLNTSLPGNGNWLAGTFGNNTFVFLADGTNQGAATSDGVTFTPVVMPATARWNAITYGTNFVALAGNAVSNVAAWSANGTNWTAAVMPSAQAWSAVAARGNTVVAVSGGWLAQSSAAAYSTDGGKTWQAATLPSSQQWCAITEAFGLFIAIARNTNVYATSPDGINWKERIMPANTTWQSVRYGNGFVVALAGGSLISSVVATTTDGINWTQRAIATSAPWVDLAYGAGLFVAIAWGGNVSTIFIDNASTSQYICITGTAGSFVRAQ